MKKLTPLIILISILASCTTAGTNQIPSSSDLFSVENPSPMGDRVLGINISENENGFYDAFLHAQEANVEIVELNIPWNAIEPEPMEYVDPWGGVFGQTAFYGENDIKLSLSIALINTVAWELPSDLALDDDNFTQRFNQMISYVISSIPENVEIASISIGNEVDYVLKDDEWDKYTSFVNEAIEHIKSINPNIKVGVKTTVMGGLLGYKKDYIVAINENTDVVMLNYYPQNDKFQVLAPDIVFEHFDIMAETFPNREIWITEIGYQSGDKYCASSELMQAEFYHNMFAAWDEHSEQINTIQIDWLHDQSRKTIAEFKKYYGSDPALVEYLSTLGLRNYDGTDKLAWLQLLDELDARK